MPLWFELSLRELNKQTYYYVLMFQIIRVLAHTMLIFIIPICVAIFFFFSIFCACGNDCFVASYTISFNGFQFCFPFVCCSVCSVTVLT